MPTWAFVVLYLFAFVLVQLAVYRYLRGRSDEEPRVTFAGATDGPSTDDRHDRGRLEEGAEPPGPADAEMLDAAADRASADRERPPPEDGRRCPSCGTTNATDGSYTFCRNCASRLPG